MRRSPTTSNSASVSFSLRRAGGRDLVRDRLLERAARHRAASADRGGSTRAGARPRRRCRRWLVSHDSSRVSRAAIALRSVRSAAENRRPVSETIATRPATSVGPERSASAITERGLRAADDHRATGGRGDARRARRSGCDSPRPAAARDAVGVICAPSFHHTMQSCAVKPSATRLERLGGGAGEIDERRRDQAARAREVELGRRSVRCARSRRAPRPRRA